MKTKFEDLTGEEYEALAERAFDDTTLCEVFIEVNADDFDQYLAENDISYDYAMDWEMNYLESRDDTFLEYAFDYYAAKARKGVAS